MQSKGTIIYVGGFEMPDKNAAAHRVLNNAKVFSSLGYHVVFCGVDRDIAASFAEPISMGQFENVPAAYPKCGKEWVKYLINFQHIKKTFSQYSNVKFAIAYNMHAVPLAKLMKYCKRKGIKLIADVTEWYENRFSITPIKFVKWVDTAVVMRVLQKRVDGMIAISTYLERYYKRHVSNIVVVPPLVDITDEKWHQKVEKDTSYVEFVYSGSPGTDKDKIGLIVESFCNIKTEKPYRFRVIGITEEQFLQMYPNQKECLDILNDKIEFCGRVSHPESIAALLRADYCIFIRDRSRKNMAGFPTKFVECVTSGVGIIANDVSDIRQYFPKEDGYYIISDVESDSIQKVINIILQGNVRTNKLNGIFDFREKQEQFSQILTLKEQ